MLRRSVAVGKRKDVETVIETVEVGDVKKAPSITTTAESAVAETCTKALQVRLDGTDPVGNDASTSKTVRLTK